MTYGRIDRSTELTLALWGGPLWLRVGAVIAYGYSNGRAPAERKVRIMSAPPAKRAAGAAGKCLKGPLREVKPRIYGSGGSSLVNDLIHVHVNRRADPIPRRLREKASLINPLIESEMAYLVRRLWHCNLCELPSLSDMVEMIIDRFTSKAAYNANKPNVPRANLRHLRSWLTRAQLSLHSHSQDSRIFLSHH
ncbi:hypothetical protein HAX54_044782 [Datura stramonium]|uniref:Uncharacterized protein n=1 Tax=Datura stramonium TaxID=4076 RepID=A0ABS8SQ81_DATST|nr:hypothetical protein [Datura stramonium]